jgi:site-specific DNA-methyltransferase (adenine-specific)
MKGTETQSFGTGKREAHDASAFYERNLYGAQLPQPASPQELQEMHREPPGDWANQVYCQSAEQMAAIPDNSIALAFTSPPYNVGKDYEGDLSLEAYFGLIERVGREVYRVLRPGGRYVINIANLGRKPYIPLHAFFYQIHMQANFLPMGEIIWQKGKGASGSCAWGSWQSAKAPRLRDLHEYLLVFAKAGFSRPERGESDITRDEFLQATLSVWEIPPESARRVGHPAPFPVELARRVIGLYSYVGDVVLDPFLGSGTTCVAAKQNHRLYVGYDISAEYCALAEERLRQCGNTDPDTDQR